MEFLFIDMNKTGERLCRSFHEITGFKKEKIHYKIIQWFGIIIVKANKKFLIDKTTGRYGPVFNSSGYKKTRE